MKPNNVCIQKNEVPDYNGTSIKYQVVLRNNYSVLRICEEHSLLKEAVDNARIFAEKYKIPLCCSCSLLNRPETKGLKMF